MRLAYYAGCVTILLFFPYIAAAEGTATVHGVAYEWNTFEPLDNIVIEVNSTPMQSMVAKYGIYSFDLPNGTYLITASSYEDDRLSYYGDEVITVSDEGNYVVDMLLVPVYQDTVSDTSAVHQNDISFTHLYIFSFSVVLILLISLMHEFRKRPSDTVEEKANDGCLVSSASGVTSDDMHEMGYHPITPDVAYEMQCELLLSSEQQEIIDIIRSHGGTMTQKDLRKLLTYSEGKVSVMLLGLENCGMIRKTRKGRSNIIFLLDE
ncbi:DUF7343 domain-containing protein [Methanolobus profundi]|uniref:Uncharacterized membrane protein n=1 Tax=Methanolobus profundi TaxID=487685 RepID=A0A1I4TNH4_9EURY|nr:hypothetical protein [Methanolobus profundi]SFM78216.1 Uncharacterized membrane protein [Methanolobus profundi]